MTGLQVQRGRRRAGGAAVALVLALALGLAGCSSGAKNGQVGDCAKDATGSDDISVVACSDGDAKYKIVGIDESVSSGGASAACLKYDEADKTLWFGKSGDLGRALCLQELKK
jgi:hypothetical protein